MSSKYSKATASYSRCSRKSAKSPGWRISGRQQL